jgi:glycosyltransferase involved in cell wall biosynthesis
MKLSNLNNHINNQTIDYLGFVKDMPNLLSKFDILIFPSSYGEGIPKIMLESMASGLLVISSKFNQFESIITHNQTGFILNTINSIEIIKMIEEIKSLDDDKINLISNSAKNFAITNFNVEDVIIRHITIYKNLLN